MAIDFLEEIYKEAYVVTSLKKMMSYCHKYQWTMFKDSWESQLENMVMLCRRYTTIDEASGVFIWSELESIKLLADSRDLRRIGDKIEGLINYIYKAIETTGKIDVEEGKYRLFSSKSGFLCLQDLTTQNNLISCVDPAWEAYEKASVMFNPKKNTFCTLGCELGYLAWQMYELSNRSIDVYVYDTDSVRLEYALNYGVLGCIPEDRLQVLCYDNQDDLVDAIVNTHFSGNKEAFTIFNVEEEILSRLSGRSHDVAELICREVYTDTEFRNMVEQNFYRNFYSVKRFVYDIETVNLSKEWVVVGGGPSVDYNIEYLKYVQGKKTIIAATTIYKRLINEGIKPDFINVVDMQNRTYKHLDGVIENDVPLIMTDCSNWMFGALYPAEKYIIPTGHLYFSSEIYSAKGIKTWQARGTVTAMGMEIAVFLGAESVELIGVDLAYPGEKSHAEGTMDCIILNKENYIEVTSVDGGNVCTDSLLKSYITEIESVIEEHPKTKFYNLSKHGAFIRGCIY